MPKTGGNTLFEELVFRETSFYILQIIVDAHPEVINSADKRVNILSSIIDNENTEQVKHMIQNWKLDIFEKASNGKSVYDELVIELKDDEYTEPDRLNKVMSLFKSKN